MNTKFFRLGLPGILAGIGLLLSGCGTVSVPVAMKIPGEFKLSGVSKIAILEFNTLSDDAFAGIAAADRGTCELVRRAVAAAFYETPMYEVVDLVAEKQVAGSEPGAFPDKRFDAVAVGCLWWQETSETLGEYPQVFTLETWDMVPYKAKIKDPISGEEKIVERKAHVTTRMDDDLQMLRYRSRHAALMLSLAIYRVGLNGELEKVVDTYQITDTGFVVDNGSFRTEDSTFGPGRRDAKALHVRSDEPKEGDSSLGAFGTELLGIFVKAGQKIGSDVEKAVGDLANGESDSTAAAVDPYHNAAGKVVLPSNTVTIPTDLQAHLFMAAKLSEDIARRVAPSTATFNIPYDFDDKKLADLIRNGAYTAAEQYAVRAVRETVGAELAARIGPLEAYGEPAYPVPRSSEKDLASVMHKERGFQQDKFDKILLDRKADQLLFALGLCQEATGRSDEALYTYRTAFDLKPDQSPAQGIARCRIALGSAGRIKEQDKETRKASEKARLD